MDPYCRGLSKRAILRVHTRLALEGDAAGAIGVGEAAEFPYVVVM